jgi:hypothetical protein
MSPYIQGNMPYEACAAQLEQRLNTYMSEYPAREHPRGGIFFVPG